MLDLFLERQILEKGFLIQGHFLHSWMLTFPMQVDV